MNKYLSSTVSIAKSILVIILGLVVVNIVNLPHQWIQNSFFNGEISLEGLPLSTNSQIVFLIIVFIAGMSGAFVVGFLAHRAKWLHVWIFCGIAVAGDIYAIIDPLVEQPTWVKIVILVSIPPQIWIGGKLGIISRKSDKS